MPFANPLRAEHRARSAAVQIEAPLVEQPAEAVRNPNDFESPGFAILHATVLLGHD